MGVVTVTCIEKYRDSSGNIIGYAIQDGNNQIRKIKSTELKQAMRSGKVRVNNLKLTSNNRIIDDNNNGVNNIVYITRSMVRACDTTGTIHFKSNASNLINKALMLRLDISQIEDNVYLLKSGDIDYILTNYRFYLPKDSSGLFKEVRVNKLILSDVIFNIAINMDSLFECSEIGELDFGDQGIGDRVHISNIFSGAKISKIRVNNPVIRLLSHAENISPTKICLPDILYNFVVSHIDEFDTSNIIQNSDGSYRLYSEEFCIRDIELPDIALIDCGSCGYVIDVANNTITMQVINLSNSSSNPGFLAFKVKREGLDNLSNLYKEYKEKIERLDIKTITSSLGLFDCDKYYSIKLGIRKMCEAIAYANKINYKYIDMVDNNDDSIFELEQELGVNLEELLYYTNYKDLIKHLRYRYDKDWGCLIYILAVNDTVLMCGDYPHMCEKLMCVKSACYS